MLKHNTVTMLLVYSLSIVGVPTSLADIPSIPDALLFSDLDTNDETKTKWSIPISIELKQTFSQKGFQSHTELPKNAVGSTMSGRLYGNLPINNTTLNLNLKLFTEFKERETYHLDSAMHTLVQELYVSYPMTEQSNIAIGRINLKSGVASGFNPTDWFKKDSLANIDSFDPADRREDRLGIVVLQGNYFFDGGLWQIGYRPKLVNSTNKNWQGSADVIGLSLNRTNNNDAFFIKFTPTIWDNLSLTSSLYYEKQRYGAALEASFALQDDFVIYTEWFLQKRQTLLNEIRLNHNNDKLGFYNQLVVGSNIGLPSWLVQHHDISLFLEYHYNEAGLKTKSLSSWQKMYNNEPIVFYNVLQLSNTNQEPLSAHQLFARFNWKNIIESCDLSLISAISPQDESGFMQGSWKMSLTDTTQIELQLYRFWGGNASVYGVIPSNKGATLSFIHNF